MVKPLNIRRPDMTHQQLIEYVQAKNLTQTQVIVVAIDRLVHAELREEGKQPHNK